ncbi:MULTISPECIES: helix-turn-helix domain-containing protein [Microbacterium]|jgi:transcriptional regulator with XRE-family HTH domain|uniref:helix-turn-helix domain-containing protein n=1 Tax=Microbacterium TaxID=33882 RepID=UPI001484C84D|nr:MULTISPECIES: helix-turn-helix domain-containing protein [unclassified Microbacterium]MBN9152373.1 helix-turn-helix domain-containing protein [Microbacterium sp.]
MSTGQRPIGTGSGRRLADQMQMRKINMRDLAARAGCDERTIQRALNGETTPQLRVAESIAAALDCSAEDLWPRVGRGGAGISGAVWVRMFPSRAEVPIELWRDVLSSAASRIDICMYGGTFLFDNVHGFIRIIHDAAAEGTPVRIMVGDPGASAIHQRGVEEGIGDAIAGRCRMTLSHLEALDGVDGVELRTHATPLYVTMFFIDDTLYANHHILGSPAGDNPVYEVPADANPELWQTYNASFERIWDGARAVTYPLGY